MPAGTGGGVIVFERGPVCGNETMKPTSESSGARDEQDATRDLIFQCIVVHDIFFRALGAGYRACRQAMT